MGSPSESNHATFCILSEFNHNSTIHNSITSIIFFIVLPVNLHNSYGNQWQLIRLPQYS